MIGEITFIILGTILLFSKIFLQKNIPGNNNASLFNLSFKILFFYPWADLIKLRKVILLNHPAINGKWIQEQIAEDPSIIGLGDVVLKDKERLDLLAIDKSGNIVVIENKLDDSGKDVVWQVLKYASYCASLTKSHIKDIFQEYLDKIDPKEKAEEKLIDFFEANDYDEIELNESQRIIMASGNFRKEVTSTVLWLLNNYKLKIQCFKITPYSHSDHLFLNVDQILPVKEVEDYIIKIAEKNLQDSDTKEEIKARHKIRLEFWRKMLEKINKSESNLFQNINPGKDNWLIAGVGLGGVGLAFVVSGTFARTEVTIARPDAEENKFIFDELFKQREQIESSFGGELTWERLDTKKMCRIKNELSGVSLYEEDDWQEMINFMNDSMIRMEKAFTKPLKAINQKLKIGHITKK